MTGAGAIYVEKTLMQKYGDAFLSDGGKKERRKGKRGARVKRGSWGDVSPLLWGCRGNSKMFFCQRRRREYHFLLSVFLCHLRRVGETWQGGRGDLNPASTEEGQHFLLLSFLFFHEPRQKRLLPLISAAVCVCVCVLVRTRTADRPFPSPPRALANKLHMAPYTLLFRPSSLQVLELRTIIVGTHPSFYQARQLVISIGGGFVSFSFVRLRRRRGSCYVHNQISQCPALSFPPLSLPLSPGRTDPLCCSPVSHNHPTTQKAPNQKPPISAAAELYGIKGEKRRRKRRRRLQPSQP